jgi:pimeloyl-ACP methyl ester carboxylesterase
MNATSPSVFKTLAGEKAVMALYDSALARWPVPHETLNISTRHGQTFVIASGAQAAPALVLLHGAGTNSAIWGGDFLDYSRDHRVYAVDLLGEAGKSAPNRPAWDSPAYAEWLDDVLNALKVEKASLVGISQGAWTALKYAVYCPERVDKLVLITPGGVVPDRMTFLLRMMVLSLLGRRGIRGIMKVLFGDQTVPDGVEEVTAVVMSNFKARVGILPIFSDEELKRLTMPTLLLGGSKDALRDLEKIAARMRSLVPYIAVTIIPGAGHALLNTPPHVMPFLASEQAAAQAGR